MTRAEYHAATVAPVPARNALELPLLSMTPTQCDAWIADALLGYLDTGASASVSWPGGAAGWDPRRDRGFYVKGGEVYPDFFQGNVDAWIARVARQIRKDWLAAKGLPTCLPLAA